jgi:parallel beta-helix repeat protein
MCTRYTCVFVLLLASIITVPALAQTNISGSITTQTWTAANSPYRVTGTITVQGKLTIEPGVDVLFDADVQFVVDGTLDAVGTETDSIRFIKGTAAEWGGLRIIGSYSTGTIHYTRISDGNADGAAPDNNGGGIYLSDMNTRLEMHNSVVTGNTASGNGGGLYNDYIPTVTLTNCTISGNTASYGGGLYNWGQYATATLTNCTISGNTASLGGGISNSSSANATLSNCTVTDNTASLGGGLYSQVSATTTLTHCIMWGDTQQEVYISSGIVDATYSDIQGDTVWTGTGNINADPIFVDAANGDFHLQAGSPCIDTGYSAFLDEDDTRSDMGVYGGGYFLGTAVSGNITTTTWTAANSPYQVTGTITVPTSNTLTIEPGVDVWFEADVPFVVSGAIEAVGTETDSIRFIRGLAMEWGGLRISGGETSTIAYARISDGHADGSAPYTNGGGIYLYGSSTKLGINNSVISGNTASYGGGLYNSSSATATLTDCMITGNTASNGGGLYNSSFATLTNCTIRGNTATGNGGGLSNSSSTSLTNCVISDNAATGNGGGLYNYSSIAMLTNCIMWGDAPQEIYVSTGTVTAAYSDIEGSYTGTGNINADPLFVDTAAGDYHLQVGSPCIDTGHPVYLDEDDTQSDIGVYGGGKIAETAVYGTIPTTTWTAANSPYYIVGQCTVATGNMLSIDSGVDVLFIADVQFVVEGALDANGTETDSIRFVKDLAMEWGGLRISGGDSSTIHYTRISDGHAEGSNPNSYGGGIYLSGSSTRLGMFNSVISGNTASGDGGGLHISSATATLTNCTISGNTAEYGGGLYNSSTATLTNCTIDGNTASVVGGGLYNYSSATETLTNCTITDNTATGHGGGLYNYSSATATLTGCMISGNRSNANGGGFFNYSFATATLKNCTIIGNRGSSGGGLYNYSKATATLTNCTINGNTASGGGGLYNYSSATATLTNCTINGNTATHGGGLVNSATATLTNCTISDNTASFGGGLYNSLSATLTNCTINSNKASSNGGGLYNYSNTVTLMNCIMWGDSLQEVYTKVGGTVAVAYSNIQGGYTGTGNINADPLFVDAAAGDYHLQSGSPCIDTGHPAYLDEDDTLSDMGVYGGGKFGTTAVYGTIPTTTWTAANSPYYVVGQCTVATGNMLSIDSGVDVLFTADVQFVVLGAFEANGTQTDSIRFIRGIAMEWGGLRISGGDSSTIHYTRISDGHAEGSNQNLCGGGIYLQGSSTRLGMFNSVISGNTAFGDGGGLYISYSSATLTNCTISGNTAGWGGGLYNWDSFTATLTNCTITGNTAWYGGGLCNGNAMMTLTDCTINGNTANTSGGGLYNCYSATATLTNCAITGNTADYGGGLNNCESSTTMLSNCAITGNTALRGGGVYNDVIATLMNCTISSNTATQGGGLFNAETATLTNCTFTSNTASSGGGGLYSFASATATLTNCIMWDDSSEEVEIENGTSTVSATYSDIQGGYIGTGNINSDPLFVDAGNGNYSLQVDSPCIDAGDPASPIDPDGTPTDMGAIYFAQPVTEYANLPNVSTPRGTTVDIDIVGTVATSQSVGMAILIDPAVVTSSILESHPYDTGTTIISGDTLFVNLVSSAAVSVFDDTVAILTLSISPSASNGTYPMTWVPYPETHVDDVAVGTSDGQLEIVGGEPIWMARADTAADADTEFAFTVGATDPTDDQLTYSSVDLPTGATFDTGTRLFSWTPERCQSGDTLAVFFVSDGVVAVNDTVDITVWPFYGDVTGDHTVSALDAANVLEYAIRKDGVSIDSQRGDVSNNARISSYDAALILRKVVNPAWKLPSCGGAVPAKPAGGNAIARQLMWERVETGWRLSIDDPTEFISADLVLAVPGDPEAAVDIESASAVMYADGMIRIGIARVDGASAILLEVPSPSDMPPRLVSFSLNDGLIPAREVRPVPFALSQNYPNPFNPSTTVRFGLPAVGHVSLTVYSINGQVIRTLANGNFAPGEHTVVWDGRDNNGRAAASGVYVYCIQLLREQDSTRDTAFRRMILVR